MSDDPPAVGVIDALGDHSGRVLGGLLGVFFFVAPFVLPAFQKFTLANVMVVIVFATGFNLLYGYTGYLSFGHAMFFGIGGYSIAWWATDQVATPEFVAFGGVAPLVEFLVAVAFGVLLATAVSIVVGYFSVRLDEIYFAMLTLSFSMAFYAAALKNIGGFTNGTDGLTVILDTIEVFGTAIAIGNVGVYYFIVFAFFVPSMYALWRIVNSPFGLICKAIREDDTRARVIGVDVRRHSWLAFIVSAFFSAIAGALAVPLRSIINPLSVHWTTSAVPVVVVVLGGTQTFAGPIAGAFAFRYLRWGISQFPVLEQWWQFVFGVLIVIVLLFFSRGVSGGLEDLYRWLGRVGDHYRKGGIEDAVVFVNESVGDAVTRVRATFTGVTSTSSERSRAD